MSAHFLSKTNKKPQNQKNYTLVIGKVIGYRKIMNIKVKKILEIIFTSLHIMAFCSFIFKHKSMILTHVFTLRDISM